MFLKATFSVQAAQERLFRFREVQYTDLINPDQLVTGLFKMRAVYLYTSFAKKSFTKTWQPRRGSSASRLPEPVKFDRFHAFGIPQSPHVVLVFGKSEMQSSDFLRYSNHFTAGDEVWLILPKSDGNVQQNPILRFEEPVVPVETSLPFAEDVMPPSNVLHGSYVFFDFISHKISVNQASPLDHTCSGVLCDGQFGTGTCGCTKAPAKRHWTLSVTFTCPEIDEFANDELNIISNRLTRLLIDTNVRSWPATDARVDPFEIFADVELLVEAVNIGQGFRVKGWFKPSINENKTTAESYSFHICYLMPRSPLTSAQSHLVHGREPAPLSDNTGSPIPPRSFVYTPERTEHQHQEDDNNAGPAATQDQHDDGTQNEDDQGGGRDFSNSQRDDDEAGRGYSYGIETQMFK